MWKYLVKRFLLMFPTLVGVAVVTFRLIRVIPGDVVELRLPGGGGPASPAATRGCAAQAGAARAGRRALRVHPRRCGSSSCLGPGASPASTSAPRCGPAR